jgi:DNA excision repair protein ERCC-4
LIDSREQRPFDFASFDVVPEVAALPCGDYSLPRFVDKVALERKALDDLIGCLMGSNRDRFERELARGGHYEFFSVVVEGSLADLAHDKYVSQMKPHSALQSIIAFQVRYRVPFLWCGTRTGAEYMTHGLLSKFLREIQERFKLPTKAQEGAV